MLTEGNEAGASPIKQQQQQPDQQQHLISPSHNNHTNGNMGLSSMNHLQVMYVLEPLHKVGSRSFTNNKCTIFSLQ